MIRIPKFKLKKIVQSRREASPNSAISNRSSPRPAPTAVVAAIHVRSEPYLCSLRILQRPRANCDPLTRSGRTLTRNGLFSCAFHVLRVARERLASATE